MVTNNYIIGKELNTENVQDLNNLRIQKNVCIEKMHAAMYKFTDSFDIFDTSDIVKNSIMITLSKLTKFADGQSQSRPPQYQCTHQIW